MSKGLESIFKAAAFFISGLVSGVAVGLLAAPKSGKELREDITHKSWELQRATKDNLEELQNIGMSNAIKAAHAIRNTADNLSSKLDELSRNSDKTLANKI